MFLFTTSTELFPCKKRLYHGLPAQSIGLVINLEKNKNIREFTKVTLFSLQSLDIQEA